MKEYLVPTGDGEAQFIERRSRFIGHIFLTETEEEALARLKQMREQYWDATHNVYAYIIRDGATRFSDDGEPGGTAGMPVLQVLQREELYNVTCVVTRYFGGILLGVVECFCSSITVLAPYTDAIEFTILIVILLVRPTGFLGKKRREKV